MDDVVLRAMAKWPNVPAVFGWLALDMRGRWRLKGEPIRHRPTVEFINRNYLCDPQGRWFFQNGPQRVFIDLEYTPWIIRLDGDDKLRTHTDRPVRAPQSVWVDEHGCLLMLAEDGVGLTDESALFALSDCFVDQAGAPLKDAAVEAALGGQGPLCAVFVSWAGKRLAVARLSRSEVAGRFGFVPTPSAEHRRA